MKLAILRIGTVDSEVVSTILQGLNNAFPQIRCALLESVLPVPEGTYHETRHQFNSTQMLAKMADYTKKADVDLVLGVTEVDLYSGGLNFVFGEAQYSGKVALISLFRLRPEFYGQPANIKLFLERAVKEAVHEVGHTLGLGHCGNSSCVMFFSNSIFDTDIKREKFCEKCSLAVAEYLRKRD